LENTYALCKSSDNNNCGKYLGDRNVRQQQHFLLVVVAFDESADLVHPVEESITNRGPHCQLIATTTIVTSLRLNRPAKTNIISQVGVEETIDAHKTNAEQSLLLSCDHGHLRCCRRRTATVLSSRYRNEVAQEEVSPREHKAWRRGYVQLPWQLFKTKHASEGSTMGYRADRTRLIFTSWTGLGNFLTRPKVLEIG
jgi:hypothetical protein